MSARTNTRTLRAELILSGSQDGTLQAALLDVEARLNGFGDQAARTGAALTLGLTVPVVKAGKDIMALYVDFDDMMRKVQAATGASEADMDALREAARAAGATTRFSASDGAEALYYLGLSGMGAQKSIDALPATMSLAAAAGMSMADASTIIVDSMAALGLGIEDMDLFVDQLAQTTRSANTDMSQLGEGILTVGATARMMRGGTVELNAALAQMASYGIKGAEGGTKLRNILLSLAAPTDKAAEFMADLGASEEDLAEALGDMDVGAAQKMMATLGFSAFDAQGQFKPLLQIFQELDAAMQGMDDKERALALSTIFNKRDLAGVEALLGGTGGELATLQEKIENSAGAAREFQDTLEGGLGGALRELESAWEEVQHTFGEAIAPGFGQVADFLRETALAVAGMEPEKVQALVGLVGALAAAGPALTLLGLGAKGLGTAVGAIGALVATPAGAFFVAAAGLGALALGVRAVADAQAQADLDKLAEKFGAVTLSTEQISALVGQATAAYDSGILALAAGAEQLKGLVTTYQSETAAMSSLLMQAFLGGGELSPAQQDSLSEQANKLVAAGQSAIATAWQQATQTNAWMFAGTGEGDQVQGLLDGFFGQMRAEAEQKGSELRGALYAAMADGVMDAEEQKIIDKLVEDYNALMGKVSAALAEQELAYILTSQDTSTLDQDSFREALEALEAERAGAQARAAELVARQKAAALVAGKEEGWTDAEIQAMWATIDQAGEAAFLRDSALVDEYVGRLVSSTLEGVTGNFEKSYASGLDEAFMVKHIAENLYHTFGEGWQTHPEAAAFAAEHFGGEWLVNYSGADPKKEFETALSLVRPVVQGLYEQAQAAEDAGLEVPAAVARGIEEYEALLELSESSDAMYRWLLEALGGSPYLAEIYQKVFGIGAGLSGALGAGMTSGAGAGAEVYGPPPPSFGQGGTVTTPTLAVVGDYPETIVPHRRDANSWGLLQAAARGTGFGLGEVHIQVHGAPITINGGKPAEMLQALAEHRRELVDMISEEMRRRAATTF